MSNQDEFDFSTIDYNALTHEQWALVKKRAMARAHAERSQALRDSLVALWTVAARALAAMAGWRKTYRTRRAVKAAAAELHALDDRMLKDMGLYRGDISAAVRAGGYKAPPRTTTKVSRAA